MLLYWLCTTTNPAAVTTGCRSHSCLHILTESDDIYYFSGVLIHTVHLNSHFSIYFPQLFLDSRINYRFYIYIGVVCQQHCRPVIFGKVISGHFWSFLAIRFWAMLFFTPFPWQVEVSLAYTGQGVIILCLVPSFLHSLSSSACRHVVWLLLHGPC